MGDEIVRKLLERNGRGSRLFEKEDEPNDFISRYNREHEDDDEVSDSDLIPDEGEGIEDEDTPRHVGDLGDEDDNPSPAGTSSRGMRAPAEEIPDDAPSPERPMITKEENANPLDNDYAVKYKMGERVALSYADGTKSNLEGIIEGYDKEGFYRVKWAGGLITNGITDIALADIVAGSMKESTCVCGHTDTVVEDGYVVCDNCGRKLQEVAPVDEARKKKRRTGPRVVGKIYSPPREVSTANKPNIADADGGISEAIKKALKS